ncbi:hypothetical protein AYI69_g1809 [Smittium culicis]|uniref:Uncharacterized protein n=1 Tax=Smittium culicis TaxID=133412 RepID=A0A1R1YP61_9FUNG|nr:hypothetical protein AYI69_g1809 [Smittium culicis]
MAQKKNITDPDKNVVEENVFMDPTIPKAKPKLLSNHVAVTDIAHEKTSPEPIPNKTPWKIARDSTEVETEDAIKEINPIIVPNRDKFLAPTYPTTLPEIMPENKVKEVARVTIHATFVGLTFGNSLVTYSV